MNKALSTKKYFSLAAVLLVAAVLYIANLTRSALWVDEVVEYFFSKVLVGEVPGVPGLTNMYQRICSTFQPPLYNVLMYIWLLFFDFGEASFRLFGVLVTLAGAVGIFFCIDKLCGAAFAPLGTLLYLLSPGVFYYALECAEYSLMLTSLCWTLYFFLCAVDDGTLRSCLGFFIFACLSVYSQYGAAFPVLVLYILLAVRRFREHKGCAQLLVCTLVTAIVAVVPLLVFFLMPQMQHQNSLTVSHTPAFRVNFFVDFFIGIIQVIRVVFLHVATSYTVFSQPKNLLFLLCQVLIIGAACVLVLILLCKKNKAVSYLFLCCGLVYILYFIASVCSFYGYNGYDQQSVAPLGGYNFGGRYALFFAPLLVVLLTCGWSVLYKSIQKKKGKVPMIIGAAGFCILGCIILFAGWEKDDTRGAMRVWQEASTTGPAPLILNSSNLIFQYYLCHNKDYAEAADDNDILIVSWHDSDDPDAAKQDLEDSGFFEQDHLYYMGPHPYTGQRGSPHYFDVTERLLTAMRAEGYRYTILYDHVTVLYCFER